MKFLADESVDHPVVTFLISKGIDVTAVADFARGAPDTEVLQTANKEKRILLTMDKDFGELVFREQKLSAGVVLIRLHNVPAIEKATIVYEAIDRHGDELAGSFSVITSKSIRIRK